MKNFEQLNSPETPDKHISALEQQRVVFERAGSKEGFDAAFSKITSDMDLLVQATR